MCRNHHSRSSRTFIAATGSVLVGALLSTAAPTFARAEAKKEVLDLSDEPEPKKDEPVKPDEPKVPSPLDTKKEEYVPETDGVPRAGPHGSQVASSEWLPITIGAAIGVVIGGLAGNIAEPGKGPVIGPIAGAIAGGFAGGAGGAWLIRGIREQDTKLAGTLTGLGFGAGIGAILYANTEPLPWRITALVLLPVMGAFAGHRLAIVVKSKDKKDTPIVTLRPSIAPTFGLDSRLSGATAMLAGSF